ncbi:MAG: hypothetical protein R3A47_06380 [Polyangiales bacterium]
MLLNRLSFVVFALALLLTGCPPIPFPPGGGGTGGSAGTGGTAGAGGLDVTPSPEVGTPGSNEEILLRPLSGPNATQQGVQAGAIDAERATRFFGWVYDASGAPLSDVRIEALNHPEFGWTLSRDDGRFDFVVHGDIDATLQYKKSEHIEVQRNIESTRGRIIPIPDVVMHAFDGNVTAIAANMNTMQVAQGSVIDDGDGQRQATLMFPAGTSAQAVLADGSTVAINTLSVRATEFTVGDRGPASMPGLMPEQIAYNYAAEFSVDEATNMGADHVEFSQPVYFYLENFIDAPVGTAVPTGYYDRNEGRWVASEDGVVIKVLSVSGGLAMLDTTGDDVADDPALWGISDDERQQIAARYDVGQTLWRVRLTHFSPWDCNWPYRCLGDCPVPPPPVGEVAQNDPLPDDTCTDPSACPSQPDPNPEPDPDCNAAGSIIQCESQSLAEEFGVNGSDLTLRYQSNRSGQSKQPISVDIGPANYGNNLLRIRSTITMAGQRFETVGLSDAFTVRDGRMYHEVEWDNVDGDGQRVYDPVGVNATTCYEYAAELIAPDIDPTGDRDQNSANFGRWTAPGVYVTTDRTNQTFRVCTSSNWISNAGFDARRFGLLGLSLDSQQLLFRDYGIRVSGDGSITPAPLSYELQARLSGDGSSNPATGVPFTDVEVGMSHEQVDREGRFVFSTNSQAPDTTACTAWVTARCGNGRIRNRLWLSE